MNNVKFSLKPAVSRYIIKIICKGELMKKINWQKSAVYNGFSLAEALITLLVVCVITIASVPVITKKHRAKFN
ncbi:TPA: hypothetical protein CPT85_05170, partial [Candidatus Gastranaerophilales bacterium HUM_21]